MALANRQKTWLALALALAAGFAAGAGTFWLLYDKVFSDFEENRRDLLLAEQARVLRFLREGRQPQIQWMLEQVVRASMGEQSRLVTENGKRPSDNLRDAITDACNHAGDGAPALLADTVAQRQRWCATLLAAAQKP